ncbi:MAG: hypothetical protein A3C27_03635 [Candidatus Levybacteria bacterium RIFCSPHIGHO2_02_FULL_39_36]|nr:MAG: hypothetical protein A3E68_00370 [Candidatus Levybacteria bacterium RIFCSPHIGHO2_12_FULL_39_39]OGH27374.1 MAG: hypothetical protein A3C27_03635 [Candidatus Levybacteria bacterium RIFCSPHIGHO2_02_FULL_39_36]OGH45239.1 MAG: hypothetical protein A3H82_02810 [Candidatus Levybacteria bacterium RIFCSPLOWO2_02_FULL_39_26]
MSQQTFYFRCIAYQEKGGSFTGVCLDLDIVEEGHVTLQEAMLSINDAIISHMEATAKLGFPKELVLRPASREYWRKLEEITRPKAQKLPLENFRFYSVQSPQQNLSYA